MTAAGGGSYDRYNTDFQEFLGRTHEGTKRHYGQEILQHIAQRRYRLIVNVNDIKQFSPATHLALMTTPSEVIHSFQSALKNYVATNKDYSITSDKWDKNMEMFVGFEGSFGRHHVSPRGLSTRLLKQLVMVEGIVTKCTAVKPRLVRSVHYVEEKNDRRGVEYNDAATTTGIPSSGIIPTRDLEGNLLSIEYGLCHFRDTQQLIIQEMPERAPAGQLPRSVSVLVENDLVDVVKPGDRVRAVGAYRALFGGAQGGHSQAIFQTLLVANNICLINKDVVGSKVGFQDADNIREMAKSPDIFDRLAISLVPSIYGHEYIKKAVLLQLFGGVEKNLDNGTHIRGDINMLMVGDPSTAKSQILRFVLNIAPLAISTSGRGSSGVGLTAAVTSDRDTGERRLEAGAMVLADRGVVCIDEFDKMSDEDRVAIHEVMEQQTVTIAKAGIQASLNARCSVLAAANPVYGKYDRLRKPTENIGLPDSLLSRFDLLFIVLDNLDPEHDRGVAKHVLSLHRFLENEEDAVHTLPSAVENVLVYDEEEEKETHAETPMYVPFNPLLHIAAMMEFQRKYGRSAIAQDDEEDGLRLFSIAFIKKYIQYAKELKPILQPEAEERIVEAFSELRTKEDTKTLPVTARTMETMIRLSAAHAKSRLSHTIDIQDAEIALEIMNYALYHDGKTSPAAPAAAVPPPLMPQPEGPQPLRQVVASSSSSFPQWVRDVVVRHDGAIAMSDLVRELIAKDEQLTEEDIRNRLQAMEDADQLMVQEDTVILL